MIHQGGFPEFAPTGDKATIIGTTTQRMSGGKIVEGGDKLGPSWVLLVEIGPSLRRV